MRLKMATSLLDIVQAQAGEIDRLRAELKARDRMQDPDIFADIVQPDARKNPKRRAGQISWANPTRKEKASQRMKGLWAFRRMENATDPTSSNYYRNGQTD
jgi:hypothetical protein